MMERGQPHKTPVTSTWTADYLTREGGGHKAMGDWLRDKTISWKARRRLLQAYLSLSSVIRGGVVTLRHPHTLPPIHARATEGLHKNGLSLILMFEIWAVSLYILVLLPFGCGCGRV